MVNHRMGAASLALLHLQGRQGLQRKRDDVDCRCCDVQQ